MADNELFDYKQLDEEQIEALRAQLRGFTSGVRGAMRAARSNQQMHDTISTHSNHTNNDDWI
jgi:hypothetical protein